VQGAVQHHVHVADGLWRQPGSAAVDRLAASLLQQVGVEVVELHRGERLEPDLAEGRHDVGGGVGAVVGQVEGRSRGFTAGSHSSCRKWLRVWVERWGSRPIRHWPIASASACSAAFLVL
jgi:hypothetical protein